MTAQPTKTASANPTAAKTAAKDTGATAAGIIIFAAMMMILIGILQAFEGLAAIINNQFFVLGARYIYAFDVTGWGWAHLITGVAVALTGFGLLGAKNWARIVGIIIAIFSAIVNFFFIPYYPFWAIIIIALDVAVIWALTVPFEESMLVD